MLLSLLPLAGWAQGVSIADYTIENTGANAVQYDGTQKAVTLNVSTSGAGNLTAGTDYTVTYYKVVNSTETAIEATDVKNAGTYKVSAVGKGAYTGETAKITFTITPKPLTDAMIQTITDPIYSGSPLTPTITVQDGGTTLVKGNATNGKDYTEEFTNNTVVATTTSANAPTVTITGHGNYSGTATKKFNIVAADLTAAMIGDIPALTYDKTNQDPTPSVTFTGSTPLTLNTDYVISYKKEADGSYSDIEHVQAAGSYKVIVKGKEGSNFSTSVSAEKVFTVSPKTVYIRTNNDKVTYSATAYTPAVDKNVTFSMLEDGDGIDASDLKVQLKKSDDSEVASATDAGEYTITVGYADGKTALTNTNYTPTFYSVGKLTIEQKELTITPVAGKTKTYGTSDDYVAGKAAAEADVTIDGLLTGHTVNWEIGTSTNLTLKRTDTEDVSNNIALWVVNNADTKVEVKDGSSTDVSANYKYKFDNGTYSITGKAISILADNGGNVYNASVPTTAGLTVTIVGMDDEDAAAVKSSIEASLSIANASANVGKYVINIGDFDTTGDNWKNYNTTTITKVPGEYKITKAPLKIAVKDQYLQVGDKVIAASAETVTFTTTTGITEADKTAVLNKIALAFSATSPAVPVETGDHAGELAAGALTAGWTSEGAAATADADKGIWFNGITVDATAYNAATDVNFTLTGEGTEIKAGKLVVSSAIVPLELNAANVTAATAKTNTQLLTENANKKMNVVIKNKTLKAGKWYAISLPFSITPYDFVNAVKTYAIFDRLQKESDKLNFKISLEQIPAYTPFLVKVESEVKFKDVTFNEVTIATPATIETEKNSVWKIVNTTDEANVPNLVYFLNQEGANISLGKNANGQKFYGFEAYITTLDGNEAQEARIYIEEADGSTTAISAIAADGELVPAQGWYTLNGVKLQGVPTQKGVYINNGKKIVIK